MRYHQLCRKIQLSSKKPYYRIDSAGYRISTIDREQDYKHKELRGLKLTSGAVRGWH